MRISIVVCVMFTMCVVPPMAGEPSPCDLYEIGRVSDEILAMFQPRVSGEAEYYPVIPHADGSEAILKPKKGQKALIDYAKREIPISVLNRCTCELQVLFPYREIKDKRMSGPLGIPGLELETRPGTEQWNGKNSSLWFPENPDLVVVGEAWQVFGGDIIVSRPYSAHLHKQFREVDRRGTEDVWHIVDEAMDFLLANGEIALSEVPVLRIAMFIAIQIENIDGDEYVSAPPERRPLLIMRAAFTIGYAGRQAFVGRKSKVGAAGTAQVMPGTCDGVRKAHPKLGFAPDCNSAPGVPPEVASTAAGVLVYREKGRQLSRKFGEWLYTSQTGQLLTLAAYNTGYYRAQQAYLKHRGAWRQVHYVVVERKVKGKKTVRQKIVPGNSLLRETVVYLEKAALLTELHAEHFSNLQIAGGGAP